MADATGKGGGLEQELGELLEREWFEPPAEFAAEALITDESLHEQAARDPEAWWASLAAELEWSTEPTEVLDDSNSPFFKWFADGKLNASVNCVDRHVEAGNGDRVAFHWRGEEGEQRETTYADLHRDVQRLANVLLERGVKAGDVVGIYLPMIPEVAVAMLACARIGAPHNVVFGGFSPSAVKERMQFSDAKALITVDAARRKGKAAEIKPAVDDFLGEVPSIETVVVVRNTGAEVEMTEGRDIYYDEAIEAAEPECPPAELDAEHPLYILYSSGSTAKPKGILHTTGGYLTGVAWTTKHVFDLKPESRPASAARDRGSGARRGGQRRRHRPGSAGPAQAVAGNAAHAVQGRRPLRRDLLLEVRPRDLFRRRRDAARRDSDGYFWVIGRVDDVINVSGHRLSTAEVESAIVSHPKVAEAAVIGQTDEDTGQAICAFVTLEGTHEGSDEMVGELREHVAQRIGKLARPKRIVWSDDLPKTRSGKIMRRLLRDIAEGRELGDVTTLRDPDVVRELDDLVQRRAGEGQEE